MDMIDAPEFDPHLNGHSAAVIKGLCHAEVSDLLDGEYCLAVDQEKILKASRCAPIVGPTLLLTHLVDATVSDFAGVSEMLVRVSPVNGQ